MGLAIIAFPVLRHQEKLSTHTLEVKQFCWLHFIIKPGKIKPSSVSVTQRLLNQKPQTRQTIIFFSVRSIELKRSVGGWGPCPHGVYFLSASNFFSVVPVVGVQRIIFRALHIFHELVWIWILVKCSERCCWRHNNVLCSHMLQLSTARTVLPGENTCGHGPDRTRERPSHQQPVSVSSSWILRLTWAPYSQSTSRSRWLAWQAPVVLSYDLINEHVRLTDTSSHISSLQLNTFKYKSCGVKH